MRADTKYGRPRRADGEGKLHYGSYHCAFRQNRRRAGGSAGRSEERALRIAGPDLRGHHYPSVCSRPGGRQAGGGALRRGILHTALLRPFCLRPGARRGEPEALHALPAGGGLGALRADALGADAGHFQLSCQISAQSLPSAGQRPVETEKN